MTPWTEADFAAWMDRNGLRAADAAAILFLTPTSVKRIKSGAQTLTPRTQALALSFENQRMRFDEGIDSQADLADLAETCEEVEFSVVTGVTAAAMRGWTTASTHVRFVALPPQPARLRMPDGVFALPDPHLPLRVELRHDASGRSYRMADPVRTVVDAVRDAERQVNFHVEEVVGSALAEGISPQDLLEHAAIYGDETVAAMRTRLSEVGATLH